MSKVRLLKVALQITVAVDDGDTLEEKTCEPVVLTPTQWAEFDLDAQIATLQAQIDTPALSEIQQ